MRRGDGRVLGAPAFLVSPGVLIANDHVLKGSGWLPGWLTGSSATLPGSSWFRCRFFGQELFAVLGYAGGF